jgi:hypothetical protein
MHVSRPGLQTKSNNSTTRVTRQDAYQPFEEEIPSLETFTAHISRVPKITRYLAEAQWTFRLPINLDFSDQ